jgi:predicted porin
MADGVQIYGAFDVGVLTRNGDTQVASGLNGHNGIGFRMSEDLGNGMKISGDAMFGFALDAAGNSLGLGSASTGGGFNAIYSYLALSGDFGTVIAGRAGGARAGFIKKYDPFGGFGVGGALGAYGGSSGNADYADNVLAWITPEVLPGLKVLAAYTTNLVGQDLTNRAGGVATPLYAIAGLYSAGPLDVTVAYENLTLDNTGTNHRDVWTGAASYDFGVAKLMGLYAYVEGLDRGWQVGATVPVGEATTLKAGYVTTHNSGGASPSECTKYAVGLNHDLSKRTRLYADVARLADNDAGSSCAAGIRTYGGDYANNGAGRDNGVAYGTFGANVGIRHSF